MGAFYLAAAHMDRGGNYFVCFQLVHQIAHGGHIGDGIHRAHLVEVDMGHGYAVDLAFRTGDDPVDVHNFLTDFLTDS